jgi:hypothetical protein
MYDSKRPKIKKFAVKSANISPRNSKDGIERLNEREIAFNRMRNQLNAGITERKTNKCVQNQRKQEMMKDYNEKYAAKFIPGINKLNLKGKSNASFNPTSIGNRLREWWKLKQNSNIKRTHFLI